MQENLPAAAPRQRPDPFAVRRLAVPDGAPPYDDEQPGDHQRPDGPVPDCAEAPPESRPGPAGVAQAEAAGAGRGSPEPAAWPGQFAQVLAETLAGARPARQLRPWTTEQARRRIRQLGPMLVSGQRPQVRTIVTSAPRQDVLELAAVVGFGPRVRALAVRLERTEPRPCQPATGRWLCTAIESA